jgi:O-antigen ligase
MASAMLVESDVYRYVTVVLVIFAVIGRGADVKRVSRDWLALACYAWSIYVAVRFLFGVLVSGEKGTSEWLYVFPVFFPFVGVALYTTRQYIIPATALLLICGVVSLLFTLDFLVIFAGKRAAPLFHHNPIHAGIGAGMLFLTALFAMLHAAETGRLRARYKWPQLALGGATVALSLVGMLGSHSKGAWLALATTITFMSILMLLHYVGRWRLLLLGGLLLVTIVIAIIATPYVEKVAGRTMGAAERLTDDTLTAQGPLAAMQRSIADPTTPSSMRERLKLWSNARELIQEAPWIGWGNAWLVQWRKTTYSDVGYNLMHNGYLEIMVRHGLLGITFLLVFVIAAAHSVNDARRRGMISSSLAVYLYSISFFFFCTITTNSNNRLAIGESFFILSAAAVFAIRLAARRYAVGSDRILKSGSSRTLTQ